LRSTSPLRCTLLSALALVGAATEAHAAPAATLSMTKLQAPDNVTQAVDGFGASVSIYGTTIMVGAPGRFQGETPSAVYVFGPSGPAWAQRQKLLAPDENGDSEFGASVSLDGLTAIVGAPGASVGTSFAGAAYVLTRMGSTWTHQQRLVAVDGMGKPVGVSGELFGGSVCVSGDVAVVGAPKADGWQGAAYVFARSGSGSTWTLQQKLTANDPARAEELGASVAVSGDTVIAGAPYADINGGAAYVFVRSGPASTWTLQQRLQPDEAVAYDGFGDDAALAGDTALVGPYVFVRTGATWTQRAKLAAPADDLTELATAGAVSASIALVGDMWTTVGTNDHAGAMYLFTPGSAGWMPAPRVIAPDGMTDDRFGASLALSGKTFVVGAPTLFAQGSAYVGTLAGVDAQPVPELDAGSDPPDAATERSDAADAGAPIEPSVDAGPAATDTSVGDGGVGSSDAPASDVASPARADGSSDAPGGREDSGADAGKHPSHGDGCSCAVSRGDGLFGFVQLLGILLACASTKRRRR